MKSHFKLILNGYTQDNTEMKDAMLKHKDIIKRFDEIISEKASKHSLKEKERDLQVKIDKAF